MRQIRKGTLIATTLALWVVLSVSNAGLFPATVSAGKSIALPLVAVGTDPLKEGKIEVDANGEIEIKVERARPISLYLVVFANGTVKLTIGNLQTNSEGDGKLETRLTNGVFSGRFELSREGQLQFVTGQVSFSIGVRAPGGVIEELRVDPVFREIRAGELARFEIKVKSSAEGQIFLSLDGVPAGATAIFNPPFSRPGERTFESKLTVVTSTSTPTGLFTLVIVARTNGIRAEAQVALSVKEGPTTTTTTETAGGPGKLEVVVSANKHVFSTGETVTISGQVSDSSQNGVPGSDVSIQVLTEGGATVVVGLLQTDVRGQFTFSFVLSANAQVGTYTVFALATKPPLLKGLAHTSFVVGQSGTPSVVIRQILITDPNDSPKEQFKAGETVKITVEVENVGSAFNGMIWIQVRDSKGVPIIVLIFEATIQGVVRLSAQITLASNAAVGVYNVDAFVSDKLISKGGHFFTSFTSKFVVTTG